MSENSKPVKPDWLNGSAPDEVKFCEDFKENHPIKSIGGRFYTVDGRVHDENLLKKEIYDILKPYISSGLSAKVNSLLELLRIHCCEEDFSMQLDRIHVANGTLFLNGDFTEEKEFCRNRLPVSYDPTAPAPDRFLDFTADLLDEEDILTLQEYLGYCLIPCTKAQKMMIILGNGGEGKSRLGLLMQRLLGEGVTMNSIQKIETNKFARADLEGRLLMIDDDLEMTSMPKTSVTKTLVTAEAPVDLERKGIQSYQGRLYARFLCFGNGELTAANDHSFGFYRRQLVLYTKAPPADRRNDPFLVEKMVPELEGIFLWCFAGLQRLISNNFQFTVSAKAADSARTVQTNVNTVEAFMGSTGYFDCVPEASTSCRVLYTVYRRFCEHNLFRPLNSRSFISQLHVLADKYDLTYSNNVYISKTVRVRGFTGIQVNSDTEYQ